MDTTQINKSQKLLYYVFGIVPIVAGLDKFTNILTNWKLYLSSTIAGMLPFSPDFFMRTVGVIEIAAGLILFWRPRIGAIIVSLWLFLIALNLIVTGKYLDVAVRDLVMSVTAYVFWQLTNITEHRKAVQ